MQLHARPDPFRLSEQELRDRAAARLFSAPPAQPAAEGPVPPSDFDLNPEAEAELGARLGRRPAAVLIPVVAGPDMTVLLTQRTDHLPAHAGQIAFPGGKIDEVDAGPLETALREAEEEIGLQRALVEPLGYLDGYHTGTGFRIVPVVGLIRPGFALNPNQAEVSEVFEVPLAFLMNPANHRTDARVFMGRERYYYAMPYRERYIWGATAGILRNMYARLFST